MLKNALLVTASIIVGAGGVQLLHTQSKAPAYFLGAINVKDQDGYTKTFLPEAQKAMSTRPRSSKVILSPSFLDAGSR